MALVSGQRSSTLNPEAPMYIPAMYREVEDFSADWWGLVKSSAWFRDYWLSVSDVEESDDVEDDLEAQFEEMVMLAEAQEKSDAVEDDLEAQFEEMVMLAEALEKSVSDQSFDRLDQTNSFHGLNVDVKTMLKDIVVPNSPKERSPRSPIGPAKYQMKAARYVRTKSAPRLIHQPR